MLAGEYCNREVVVIGAEESVKVAAELMRKHHVGDLVVVEGPERQRVPIGIVTDRDLVVEVMVPGLQSEDLRVRDLVTESPVLAREDNGLFDVLEMMRSSAVRRVPVVGGGGELIGIITVDDVIGLLAEMLGNLAEVVERQPQARGSRRRP